MIVTCKQCATRFKLDSGRIKPSGTKVRCTSCKNVFRVYPPSEETISAMAAPEILQSRPQAVAMSAGFEKISEAPAASRKTEADDRWDAWNELTAKPVGENDASRVSPGGDPPLVLDLEALEVGPDVEQFEEPAIDFDLGADALEAVDHPSAEQFSESDAAVDFAGTDSLDMQDLLNSLEVEDAPVGEEVSDVDFESFDLLADDADADKGPGIIAADSVTEGGAESLDPAEIEALLDLDLALADADGNQAPTEPSAEEPEAFETASFEPAEEGVRNVEAEEDAELNIDQLAQMIAGEEASLFAAPPVGAVDAPAAEVGSPPAREAGAAPVKEEGGATDGIDLSEIELFLDQEIGAERQDDTGFEAAEAEENEGPGDDLDLGLDLDFEEESTPVQAGREEATGTQFSVTDLEQMLEDMPEEDTTLTRKTPVGAAASQGDAGALDFSDIEKLLEEEVDSRAVDEEKGADQDLELVLDFPSLDKGPGADASGAERSEPIDEELPEGAFVSLDELMEEHASGEAVFDLDQDLDHIPEEFGSASVILEGEDGLELETLTSFVEKQPASAEPIDRTRPAGPAAVEQGTKPFEMGGVDEDIFPAEEMGGAFVAAGASPKRLKARKARGVRAPFWIILILVLLGGGGYAAYNFLDLSAVHIPFIDRFFKKEAAESDTRAVSLTNVKSRFVPNAQAGILFVITGQARNGYDRPRSYFEVNGILKAKNGRPVKTQTAYCGNVLSDKDLAELDLASIQMRLNNRAGANRSNLKVPPNRSVPFMLVFSDLPTDLGEFSVEPAGSAPAD